MNAVRLLAVVGIVASLGLLAPQTGAFTSATADRSVSVAVADDENAYIGIERWPAAVAGNERASTPLLRVTNHLSTAVDLTVTVTEYGGPNRPALNSTPGGETLHVGESTIISAGLTCADSTATEPATITIRASGDGVSVAANRTVEVECVRTPDGGGPGTTPAAGTTPQPPAQPGRDMTPESTAS